MTQWYRTLAPACAAIAAATQPVTQVFSQVVPAEAPPPQVAPAPEPAPWSVLAPGAEPKSELRYRPRPEVTDRLEIIDRAATSATIDGEVAEESPDVRFKTVVRARVTSIETDGTIRLEVTIEECDLDIPGETPESVAAAGKHFQTIRNVVGTMSVSSVGDAVTVKFPKLDGAAPVAARRLTQLERILSQQVVRLCDQPIGIGGSWMRGRQNPASRTRGAITLKSHTGSVITIESDLAGTNDAASLPAPRVEGDITVRADAVQFSGREQREIDLARTPFGLGTSTLETQTSMTRTDTKSDETWDVVSKTRIEFMVRRLAESP